MCDRPVDPIDIGSELAETMRANSEAKQRLEARPKQVKNPDGTWPITECEECDADIGKYRLEAIGAVTCIECATRIEKVRKQHGRS